MILWIIHARKISHPSSSLSNLLTSQQFACELHHTTPYIKFFLPPPALSQRLYLAKPSTIRQSYTDAYQQAHEGASCCRERKGGWDDFLAMLNKLFLSSFRCDKHYFPISWCGFYCSCCFIARLSHLLFYIFPPCIHPWQRIKFIGNLGEPERKKVHNNKLYLCSFDCDKTSHTSLVFIDGNFTFTIALHYRTHRACIYVRRFFVSCILGVAVGDGRKQMRR